MLVVLNMKRLMANIVQILHFYYEVDAFIQTIYMANMDRPVIVLRKMN
nr:MAG TPA: hypothetical protein [Caudoviricetes sp.]